MKKIIGIIHPFDMTQTFYVYDDDKKLITAETTMNNIVDTILNLASTYNVNQVDLTGSKHFIEGIINETQKKEMNKYNQNKLIIKCI